jgi:hypothetical protein
MACTYRNSSDRMVIARCLGADAFFLERVVFPFELLSFECPCEAELQIWSHGLGGAELIEAIDVQSLAIEGAGGSLRLECVASGSEDDRSAPWAAAG